MKKKNEYEIFFVLHFFQIAIMICMRILFIQIDIYRCIDQNYVMCGRTIRHN